jgi:pimeloyl-ACP methyl ester carboxylesterase
MTAEAAGGSRFADVAGATIRYRRQGGGRPLVLLHPLRMQLEYFDALLSALAGQDEQLIMVDLPGHGGSSAPRVDYTAAYFTDSVERFLDALDVCDAVVVGESIGASIALGLAARHHERVSSVVALNPYDYGRWGGIRRSSMIGDAVFTSILLPAVGPIVARSGTKGVLRRVLAGGLYDRRHLPDQLVVALYQSGSRPGHARALRSLSRHSNSWISARDAYPSIDVPVTLAYGDHDWSRPHEREADGRLIPGVRLVSLTDCGHFSCLEKPRQIADLIRDSVMTDG